MMAVPGNQPTKDLPYATCAEWNLFIPVWIPPSQTPVVTLVILTAGAPYTASSSQYPFKALILLVPEETEQSVRTQSEQP